MYRRSFGSRHGMAVGVTTRWTNSVRSSMMPLRSIVRRTAGFRVSAPVSGEWIAAAGTPATTHVRSGSRLATIAAVYPPSDMPWIEMSVAPRARTQARHLRTSHTA